MNSLKAEMTTLENMASAFFNPKGITVYWKDPISVAKVVLCRSFGAIQI